MRIQPKQWLKNNLHFIILGVLAIIITWLKMSFDVSVLTSIAIVIAGYLTVTAIVIMVKEDLGCVYFYLAFLGIPCLLGFIGYTFGNHPHTKKVSSPQYFVQNSTSVPKMRDYNQEFTHEDSIIVVYICCSPNAYAYHYNRHCGALTRCSYGVECVIRAKAKKDGRRPCGKCS